MLKSELARAELEQRAGLVHRVYLPENKGESPPPVFVMVHGRAGDARVMWVFSKALQELKPVVVSPQAILPDRLGGYSWWELSHEAGETSPAPRATSEQDLESPLHKLEQFILSLKDLYGIDPHRIYGVGFSQGAALLSSLALKRPGLFRGVAMLSGFVPGVVIKSMKGGMESSLPDFFIFHGTEDSTVPFERAIDARNALTSLGAEVSFHHDKVGHKVSSSGIKKLQTWVTEKM